jgi:hypothetical protein
MKTTLLKILMRLTGASRQLLVLILPLLADSAARLLAELAPIALEVVKSLAESPHSGQQKREAALREIQTRAVQAGIRASTSAASTFTPVAVLVAEPVTYSSARSSVASARWSCGSSASVMENPDASSVALMSVLGRT